MSDDQPQGIDALRRSRRRRAAANADEPATPVLAMFAEPEPAPAVGTAADQAPGSGHAQAKRSLRVLARDFRRTRPFWAAVLILLGGAQVTYWPSTAYRFVFSTASVTEGIGVGVIIVVLGVFLMFSPVHRKLYSVLAVIFGLLSLVTSDIGGFITGMMLTLVGGSMGFAWVPVVPASSTPAHRHRRSRRARRSSDPGPSLPAAA